MRSGFRQTHDAVEPVRGVKRGVRRVEETAEGVVGLGVVTTGDPRSAASELGLGQQGIEPPTTLEYVSERATDAGCRVVSAAGVQAEMELAFASLHELCTPLLERLNAIPKPQQDALSTPSSTKNARCVEPWSSASITSTVTPLPSEIAMK
jgi:hypothetical protein